MKEFNSVQEACDYVVQKIVEQGGQCVDLDGNCWYKDNRGNHCAMGWLLDPINKNIKNSDQALYELIYDFGDVIPQIIKDNEGVFSILQEFHDAKYASVRIQRRKCLRDCGIDTSKPQYQQWVDMGE